MDGYDSSRSLREWTRGRVLAAAIAMTIALLLSPHASARAAYLGATFIPDHGAPGARIVVGYLPLPKECPRVNVYPSREATPSPPIASAHDPRLIRLVGTVSYRRGYGPNSTGPTPKTTTFEFRVPDLRPGTYGTYAQCVGGPAVSSGFGTGNSLFTVDPGPPETDTEAIAAVVQPEIPTEWPALPFAVIGCASLMLSAILWRRQTTSGTRLMTGSSRAGATGTVRTGRRRG